MAVGPLAPKTTKKPVDAKTQAVEVKPADVKTDVEVEVKKVRKARSQPVDAAGPAGKTMVKDVAALVSKDWMNARGETATHLTSQLENVTTMLEAARAFTGYSSTIGPKLEKLEELQLKLQHAVDKRSQPLTIGVTGSEKMGKSDFVNHWMGVDILPTGSQRCTWSPCDVRVTDGDRSAVVEFYSEAEFLKRITPIFETFGSNPANWQRFSLADVKHAYLAEHGPDALSAGHAAPKVVDAWNELEAIAQARDGIKSCLGKGTMRIRDEGVSGKGDFASSIRPYIAINDDSGKPHPNVFAVRKVTVEGPAPGLPPGVVVKDLAGIDAPNKRAARETFEAVPNLDLIVLVKDITRPSVTAPEHDILDAVHQGDPALPTADRTVVVLTKVDLPLKDERLGRFNFSLAREELIKQGIPEGSVIPLSAREVPDHVQKALQQELNITGPVDGFKMYRNRIAGFLNNDVPQLEKATQKYFNGEVEAMRVRLVDELPAIEASFAARAPALTEAQTVGKLWSHAATGKDAVGLLPTMKDVSSIAVEALQKPEIAAELSKNAQARVAEIARQLHDSVTPERVSALRRQLTTSGNSQLVEIEGKIRTTLDESLAESMQGLKDCLRDEVMALAEKALHDVLAAEYQGGSISKLFAEGAEGDSIAKLKTIGALEVDGQPTALGSLIKRLDHVNRYIADMGTSLGFMYAQHRDFLLAIDPEARTLASQRLPDIAAALGAVEAKAEAERAAADAAKAQAALPKPKPKKSWFSFSFRKKPEPAPEVAPEAPPPAPAVQRDPRFTPEQEKAVLDRLHLDIDLITTAISDVTSPKTLGSYYFTVLSSVAEALVGRAAAGDMEAIARGHAGTIWPEAVGEAAGNGRQMEGLLKDLKRKVELPSSARNSLSIRFQQ